jgi:hypothetical protein
MIFNLLDKCSRHTKMLVLDIRPQWVFKRTLVSLENIFSELRTHTCIQEYVCIRIVCATMVTLSRIVTIGLPTYAFELIKKKKKV